MIITRNEFEDLTSSICKSETEWAARFALLRCYDEMARRIYIAECERNAVQLKVEELRENFEKQNTEVHGLRANLSYEKETNKIIGAKLQRLEKTSSALDREIHSKPCDLYYTEMIASLERELESVKSANAEVENQRNAKQKEILRLKNVERELVGQIEQLRGELDRAVLNLITPELKAARAIILDLVKIIDASISGEDSLHHYACSAPDYGKCTCGAYEAMNAARQEEYKGAK